MATNYTPLTADNNLDPTDLNSRLTELDNAIEAIKTGTASITYLTLAAPVATTISSGAISASSSYHTVAAESGTSDDLETISGGLDYQFLVVQAASGDTIALKHGTGNILMKSDSDLNLINGDLVLLFYDGSYWRDA